MITRQPLFYSIVLSAILTASLQRFEGAQPPKGPGSLTVEEVVKLTQSALPEELIITRVKTNGKAFDLSAEELVDIKKAGVTDNVLKYLMDPSRPYSPPPPPPTLPVAEAPAGPKPGATPPPKPTTPPRQYPKDAFASKIP